MSDYTELKRAAEYAAQDVKKFADEDEEMRALQQFHEEVDPESVMTLIAECDQLKAENEALRKNAARYEWLRQAHSGHVEVVEWIGPHATGMTGEDLDAILDAAMGRVGQS
ncbi:hypothetical protein PS682_04490 [Pseudomonas fluorescens]|nr:hypothetical protein PS682_04490 [Pseudomonas fluorescens]